MIYLEILLFDQPNDITVECRQSRAFINSYKNIKRVLIPVYEAEVTDEGDVIIGDHFRPHLILCLFAD